MSLYTRAAALPVVALALLGATASRAAAGSTCATHTWQTSPQVIVHEDEFLDGGGDAASFADMVAAVRHVVDQFNAIGGTSAKIAKVTTTTDPFVYASGKKDGAIHVGFGSRAYVTSLNGGDDADALTGPALSSDCTIKQADIIFDNQDDAKNGAAKMWTFGTPFGSGDSRKFFEATATDSAKATWFRASFLHELLHAWDFKHLSDHYSFMTHRGPDGFPWANRPANDAIRPLPYEVRTLRSLYPASGSRYEVAALDTWFGPPASDDTKAGTQNELCKPSKGNSWAGELDGSDNLGGTCGVDADGNSGSTVVCPGDKLKTRVALANYSTADMDLTTELYFSTDDKLGGDAYSPDAVPRTLDAGASATSSGSFTVPSLGAGEYRPLLYVVGANDAVGAQSVASDWIPLPGTVTVGGILSCGSLIGS